MARQIGSSTAAPQPSPSNSTTTTTTSSSNNCSPGICAPPYCLQSCAYYFLPPPVDSPDSSSRVSPLMIALISVLASAFLLLSYYTFASKYCKRRRFGRSRNQLPDEERQLQARIEQLILQDGSARPLQLAAAAVNADGGLDERFIKSIPVFKFKRGDGLVESTECAICLTEFNEGESLRLMPNCQHAFHLPCIDRWLRTHSSCPVCRASMIGPPPPPPPPPPLPARQQSTAPAVSRMRVQRGGDVVVVVDGGGRDRVRFHGEVGFDERRLVVPAPAEDLVVVVEKERSNNCH